MDEVRIWEYYRSKEKQVEYNKFKEEHAECTFCNIATSGLNKIVEETKHFFVVKNRFPYETWESREVESHLMVVVKRHISELSDMTEVERTELMQILVKYEHESYSFYGRSFGNAERSMEHQHAHLIKTKDS